MFVDPGEVLALSGFDLVGTFYLTAVIVPAVGEPVLFVFRAERDLARRQSWVDRLSVWSHGEDSVARLASAIRSAATESAATGAGVPTRSPAVRVGVELGCGLTVAQAERLRADETLELVSLQGLAFEVAFVPAAEQRDARSAAATAAAATVQAG